MTALRYTLVVLIVACSKGHANDPARPGFLDVKQYDELGCRHVEVIEQCTAGWCVVPAGCFVMGSPETEWGRGLRTEERLVVDLTHSIEVAQHETTQAEWGALGFPNPSTSRDWGRDCLGPTCPVGNVNWYEVMAYANALSQRHAPALPECYELVNCQGSVGQGMKCERALLTGPSLYECRGYRLPSEAEWEYIARAGTLTAFYSGPITAQAGNPTDCFPEPNLEPIGWYCQNADHQSHPVGQKMPNAWGLYDVLGNVDEWVNDDLNDWLSLPTTRVTDPIPQINFLSQARLIKGGQSVASAAVARVAGQLAGLPHLAGPLVGFRLVRTLN